MHIFAFDIAFMSFIRDTSLFAVATLKTKISQHQNNKHRETHNELTMSTNRIRKRGPTLTSKSDIKSQLGDPLPLPYKLDVPTTNEEDTVVEPDPLYAFHNRGKSLDSSMKIRSHPIPTIFNQRVLSEGSDIDRSEQNIVIKPRPISIRSNRLRLRQNPRPESRLEKRLVLTSIASIEDKLNELRNLIQHTGDEPDPETLHQMDNLLQTLIDEEKSRESEINTENENIADQELNIMQELERLQRLKREIVATSPKTQRWKEYLWIGGVALVIVLLLSLICSQLNYEYCYYYC